MKIGSLFSGYRGLDAAVESVTGAETVWCSDIDPGANKILAHHWPDVPNHGDITRIDFTQVEPVDILTGGFPCQDVSAAGKRTGLVRYGEPNRSGLWAEMARAIDVLRPRLVVAENVRGLLSAKADAHPDVFDCLACMADTNDKPMRALGAVLGDLAGLGYDAAWHGLRASDVGAPHQRFRVFVVAWPSDDSFAEWEGQEPEHLGASVGSAAEPRERASAGAIGGGPVADADCEGLEVGGALGQRGAQAGGGALAAVAGSGEDAVGLRLLPTPTTSDGTGGPGSLGRDGGDNLRTAVTLLPTCLASDSGPRGGTTGYGMRDWSRAHRSDFGIYEEAIRQWEAVVDRPVPAPTAAGPRGGQALSPRFTEWMMGLPEGHVTDPAVGLTRNEQLKSCGNGVVPQQAEAALTYLLNAVRAAA